MQIPLNWYPDLRTSMLLVVIGTHPTQCLLGYAVAGIIKTYPFTCSPGG